MKVGAAKRLTLKRGRETKRVVIQFDGAGPYVGPMNPHVGDMCLSDGGDEWTITKVQETEVLLVVPAGKKRVREKKPAKVSLPETSAKI
jgi:hypothetical protein